MEVYAEFLRAQGRHDQASEVDARAAAIRQANAKPAPAHLADAYLVSEDVSVPSVAQRGEPQYSDEARAERLLGTGLDENAIEAVSQWHFKPGLKDGRPVKVAATIEVNYRLL